MSHEKKGSIWAVLEACWGKVTSLINLNTKITLLNYFAVLCNVPLVLTVFWGIGEAEGVTFFSILLLICYRCGAIIFFCNSEATELWLRGHCLYWPWKIPWVTFHQRAREQEFGPKQDCIQSIWEISMDSGLSHHFLVECNLSLNSNHTDVYFNGSLLCSQTFISLWPP